jgi:hypothetical protein
MRFSDKRTLNGTFPWAFRRRAGQAACDRVWPYLFVLLQELSKDRAIFFEILPWFQA